MKYVSKLVSQLTNLLAALWHRRSYHGAVSCSKRVGHTYHVYF